MSRRGLTLIVAVSVLAVASCRDDSDGHRKKAGPDPLEITTGTLPGTTEGQPYSVALQATGGVVPLTWGITAGGLPSGLTMDVFTGEIAGTPGVPPPSGQHLFTATVIDADSPPAIDSRTFLLNVAPARYPPCGGSATTGYPPLDDLMGGDYLGMYPTGLYDGTNDRPDTHSAMAPALEPLDRGGNPDPAGEYILLSIGMSNTTQEFCARGGGPPCDPFTFMGKAAIDPDVETRHLVIVNGARGGQTAATWDSPSDPNYDRIRDQILTPAGLDERQVQAAWVKVANAQPSISLPDPNADAFQLLRQTGDIVRALKIRYPNMRQVYLTSRIYAGFATTTLNPEPYAYESAYAVKWIVQAQIDQMAGGGTDPIAGDLDLGTAAPWLSWGPYVWADGFDPRSSDGLYWTCNDLEADGTHPSISGREKVGNALLHFFKTDPVARQWFLATP